MPDLSFPPSILKRYKEFIIESALATNIPSLGKLPTGGSDSTLLGTVSMGVLQATTYPIVAHYINATFQAGGKSGDGVLGFLLGATRDVTKNPDPVKDGVFSTGLPSFKNGDALSKIFSDSLAGLNSGAAKTTQDLLDPFVFPVAGTTVAGNKLAYDLYFIRQGSVDPGLWRIFSFSATQAVLIFGPAPVPPS